MLEGLIEIIVSTNLVLLGLAAALVVSLLGGGRELPPAELAHMVWVLSPTPSVP